MSAATTLNVANILKVADAIEAAASAEQKPAMGFNMGEWAARSSKERPDMTGHNCGTVGCIAGWAFYVGRGRKPAIGSFPDGYAAAYLGLPPLRGARLFGGLSAPVWISDIQPQHAVAVLRHLAATGEVDWTVGAPSSEVASDV